MSEPAIVGLRVDVDTFRGTRQGVPRLLEILEQHRILATFFFSVGPDNMGRHVWRLFRPAFFLKMLRSRAASLYGWDILLCGTFWPGRRIGNHLGHIIRATHAAGHEVGLHAWDHQRWQSRAQKMPARAIHDEIQRGFDALARITSAPPPCSAAAGWKCTDQVLMEKEAFPFRYNSDCRGTSIFRPMVNKHVCTPQIPATLPTYDELITRRDIRDDNYNESLLSMIKSDQLNVLTIHAEVEGIGRADLFADFLQRARQRNLRFCPMGELLPDAQDIPVGAMESRPTPGREGSVCMQMPPPGTCASRTGVGG